MHSLCESNCLLPLSYVRYELKGQDFKPWANLTNYRNIYYSVWYNMEPFIMHALLRHVIHFMASITQELSNKPTLSDAFPHFFSSRLTSKIHAQATSVMEGGN